MGILRNSKHYSLFDNSEKVYILKGGNLARTSLFP